jgi:hemerythrin
MAELIPWNDIYSVNIQRFDTQHKTLFKLINKLNDGMVGGMGFRSMNAALNDLVEFLRTHFTDEESAMQKFGYPGYELHAAQHQQFTRNVLDFKQKFGTGKVTVSHELLTFFQTWLQQHILRSDRAYGSFLAGKGVH